MADIIHRIGIKASLIQVYQALTEVPSLAKWWTEETSGTSSLGGKINFSFRSLAGELIGKMVMKVLELIESVSVKWRCVDGPPDWIGTDITFELSQQGDQVIIIFGHRNWIETTESFAHCSMKWAVFLLSLRESVETGNGKPSPRDLKIDNWN